MGTLGIGMTIALIAAGNLVLSEYLPPIDLPWQMYEYGTLLVCATIMAVGLSWGHITLQVFHLKLAHKIYTH